MDIGRKGTLKLASMRVERLQSVGGLSTDFFHSRPVHRVRHRSDAFLSMSILGLWDPWQLGDVCDYLLSRICLRACLSGNFQSTL